MMNNSNRTGLRFTSSCLLVLQTCLLIISREDLLFLCARDFFWLAVPLVRQFVHFLFCQRCWLCQNCCLWQRQHFLFCRSWYLCQRSDPTLFLSLSIFEGLLYRPSFSSHYFVSKAVDSPRFF